MELMSAEELYAISKFLKKEKEEPIEDALLRAAKNGSVELLVGSLDEDTIKKLGDKGYIVQEIYFYISETHYEYRIYWGEEAQDGTVGKAETDAG